MFIDHVVYQYISGRVGVYYYTSCIGIGQMYRENLPR